MVMRGGDAAEDFFNVLPEGCIANIVSLTTPRDACRLCLVSRIFRSAAESDAVWDRFLPPDCLSIASPQPYPSKKHLFLSLCDRPVLIDQGTKVISPSPAEMRSRFLSTLVRRLGLGLFVWVTDKAKVLFSISLSLSLSGIKCDRWLCGLFVYFFYRLKKCDILSRKILLRILDLIALLFVVLIEIGVLRPSN